MAVFFRDGKACLVIEKKFASVADIIDDYGRLYPSEALFRAYMISGFLEYSSGLRDSRLIKIRWWANQV